MGKTEVVAVVEEEERRRGRVGQTGSTHRTHKISTIRQDIIMSQLYTLWCLVLKSYDF